MWDDHDDDFFDGLWTGWVLWGGVGALVVLSLIALVLYYT